MIPVVLDIYWTVDYGYLGNVLSNADMRSELVTGPRDRLALAGRSQTLSSDAKCSEGVPCAVMTSPLT
jgi:hypothetical protein